MTRLTDNSEDNTVTNPSYGTPIVSNLEWSGNTSVGVQYTVVTGASGTNVYVTPDTGEKTTSRAKGSVKMVPLRLYFKFVKSKFTKLEKDAILKALAKYNGIAIQAKHLGQHAMHEQVSELIVTAAREQAILASGFDQVILRTHVDRFRNHLESPVLLDPIANFNRTIPRGPAKLLKTARDRKLFDEYFILYTPTPDQQKALTVEEKIKRKDPILFGAFKTAPGKLYVIADWVDEYCDLTVEKFVETLRRVDKDYEPEVLKLPTSKDVARITREVNERAQRLEKTNVSNWRGQARDEAVARDRPVKKSFWASLSKLWGGS